MAGRTGEGGDPECYNSEDQNCEGEPQRVRDRCRPMKAQEMRVEEVGRMRDDQRPEDQRRHLDGLPGRRAEGAHCAIIGRDQKDEADTEREDANGIGEPESVLQHHVSQVERMIFETEQANEVPFHPTVENDHRVYHGQSDRVNSEFPPPRKPSRAYAKNTWCGTKCHRQGKQQDRRITESAVPSMHRAPLTMHEREGIHERCGSYDNDDMTHECPPPVRR